MAEAGYPDVELVKQQDNHIHYTEADEGAR